MTAAEFIAGAALIVACLSAYYAYRAPIRAEKLRNNTAQREREVAIFTALMSERGKWGSPVMLSALNSMKVVFKDNSTVLDRWFIMHSNVGTPQGQDSHYYDLLAAVALHLGLSLRREDLERFFTNPTEVRETALRFHHVETAFNQLTANAAAPALPPK
jgi:uncharacterized protein DUF6680